MIGNMGCKWRLNYCTILSFYPGETGKNDRDGRRIRSLVSDIIDDPRAPDLAATVLRMGSMDRGDASIVLRTSERTARNTLADLLKAGFLKSRTPKPPVRLAFPLDYRERLFPNLFADAEFTPPEPPAYRVP